MAVCSTAASNILTAIVEDSLKGFKPNNVQVKVPPEVANKKPFSHAEQAVCSLLAQPKSSIHLSQAALAMRIRYHQTDLIALALHKDTSASLTTSSSSNHKIYGKTQLQCPSCSAPVAVPQLQCPSCSVPVAVPQLQCPSCSAPVAVPQLQCPSCSAPVAVPQLQCPSCSAPVAVPQLQCPSCSAPVAVPQLQYPSCSAPGASPRLTNY